RSRCGCCLVVVRESVCAGEIGNVSCGVVKLVCHLCLVCGACVVSAVCDRLRHVVCLRVDLVVRVAVDADLVVAGFKHVSLSILVIVGSHIFLVECDRHCLGSAWLQSLCLLECDQVCTCFLDPAVRIRRIIVYLYDVLACHIACVCHCHVEGNLSVALCDLTHLLSECRVGETIAERIDDRLVIVDQAFVSGCLPETVSYIDAFHIVYKARGNDLFLACETNLC